MPRTAIYDACVLYPAPLRDLLVRLAMADLVVARWTDQIHDEWIRNVAKNRPDLTLASLLRCRRLMDLHLPDGIVDGYQSLIPALHLPDADDRHVLAAAIHAGADAIVTFNLADFPRAVLAPLQIEPLHPDEFLSSLLVQEPDEFCETLKEQRQVLRNPPKGVDEFLLTFEQCQLTETVKALRNVSDLL